MGQEYVVEPNPGKRLVLSWSGGLKLPIGQRIRVGKGLMAFSGPTAENFIPSGGRRIEVAFGDFRLTLAKNETLSVLEE